MQPPPSPPGPPGGYQPPPGYQPYGAGGPAQAPTNSGMAIASMVLSLVGLIPCFWVFQIPGLLGLIFGFVGLNQTKDGSRKGRGMAIAGLVIGIILVVVAVLFVVYFATSDNCYRDGGTWKCYTD
jgi:uncharacterized membrane protein